MSKAAVKPYQINPAIAHSFERGAPQISLWANSVAEVIRQRSTGPNDVRFVTYAEIHQEMLNTIAGVFATGNSGGPLSPIPTAAEINSTIENLQAEIRKSLIYQALENVIGNIDVSSLSPELQESIGQSMAAIASERSVRANKDNAMAAAVNNLWASVGGTSAVIQDGQLASVSPSSATATKWLQVVASVTDPNTGLVNSTSIKQDLNSYASAVDGTFNSIYSVRAQISVGGQTVVGGFGLSATTGAGSGQGPTIDFGVRADRFFVAATSATPDGTTQENQGNSIPFMVLTTPQYVNGIYYASGVFMKRATIGDATIGTAKIADAAITNAKIGYSISSSNWDGANGWYIDKSGYANFGSIFARGDIRATSVTANTISADQIISGSLNQFYRSAALGYVDITFSQAAQAIKVFGSPGYTVDPETGGYIPNGFVVFFDDREVGEGFISGSGIVAIYTVPAGTHRVWARQGNATGFPLYTGVFDVEVIVR